MEQKLSKKQRQELQEMHRAERDKRVCDRIKAVLAYDEGYSYSEIAKILLLDDETIRRHVEDYFCKIKLKPWNGGSSQMLSKKETIKLKEHLCKTTYLYVKEICEYVKKVYGKRYSLSGMRKWLHREGFRYKKPHGIPAKANKEEQKGFIERYRRLKSKSAGKEPIYFVDSVHPHHQTRLSYGWIRKGERKEIAMTGRQYSVNLIGGICLEGHKIVHKAVNKVDGDSIVSFLIDMRQANPGKYKIHIIWDNAGYHKDRRIKEVAEKLAIKLHYLPAYSPNLNPIERLWKLLHERVRNNKYYESFGCFREAVLNFFKTIGRQKRLLRARITDNFQVLQSPQFAS